MRTNTQEAVLSAYIVSIGKRMPREVAQDAAELCRLATSLNRLNEIACNSGLTERQGQRRVGQPLNFDVSRIWTGGCRSMRAKALSRDTCSLQCSAAPRDSQSGGGPKL